MQVSSRSWLVRKRATLWTTAGAAIVGAVVGARLVGRSAEADGSGHPVRDMLARLEHAGFGAPMLASLAIWIALSVYWEVSARGAGARAAAEPTASRLVHVGLVSVGQFLLFIPVQGLRGRFIPEWTGLTAVGLALEAAGFLLAVWARRRLGRNWSGAIATNVEHELVRSGPYRWVRHPIYTGLLGLYLGTALVSGELHALLGVTLVLVAYWRKIRMEETHLDALFGGAYAEYRSRTWALVPGVF